jgi:hypothetical protein
MKKWISVVHWFFPLSLLALLILGMVWAQNLSIPDFDHEWLQIGLIGIFFLLIIWWINKNPSEFLSGFYYSRSEEVHSIKEKE